MALHFICIPTLNKCNRLRLKYGGPRLSDVTILQRDISVQNVTKKQRGKGWGGSRERKALGRPTHMQRALPPPLLTPPPAASLLLRRKAVCFFLVGSSAKIAPEEEEEAAVGGRDESACAGLKPLELANGEEMGDA